MEVYLLAVNALGFSVMLIDKYLAKNNLRRIPEASLMAVAAVGGSLGSILGMYTVRHKTRHRKFTVGLPIMLIVQSFVLIRYFAA